MLNQAKHSTHSQLRKNSSPRTNFRADAVAEWLRQWTDNLMDALRVGSIPGTGDFFPFFLMMMMVERRVAAQASAKRSECRR